MAEPEDLTQAFLARHPVAAARVLDDLPAEEVAALLSAVPSRFAAPALAAMLPPRAALCVVAFGAERAAAMLAAMRLPAIAAVLRHVHEPHRTALLETLPTAAAVACRALLRYPEDAVGAWVDASALTLPATATVRDAIDRMRDEDAGSDGRVFVVDGQRRPIGLVEPGALLRAASGVPLASLMRKGPAGIAAATPLASAELHPVWRDHPVVPVLERGDRLIGLLSRRALRRALEQRRRTRAQSARPMLAVVGAWYWDALAELVEATVAIDPGGARRR